MHSTSAVSFALALAKVSAGEWTFSWPYNEDGSCACKESEIGGLENFTSQRECLDAFAANEFEYCQYLNSGVTEEQCGSAVSISEGVLNGECRSECTAVVAGVVSLPDFLENCKFEFVVPFDDSVAVLPDSCFSNYVYGWSDFDQTNPTQAQPFRLFLDVPTPANCQELCQQTPRCVFFSHRVIADEDPCELCDFQNMPLTCILYDDTYMNQVLRVNVDHLTAPTAYCNSNALSLCREKPWEKDNILAIFDDYNCLNCGCETKCSWLSSTHITGPSFCTQPTGRDVCLYQRPTWTTTPPPCIEDTTTTTEEAATAETDTALQTTASATSTEAGTAFTDTALTETAPECVCEPETTTTTQPVCVCPPAAAGGEKELLQATEALMEMTTAASSSTTVELETTTSVGLSSLESRTEIELSTMS